MNRQNTFEKKKEKKSVEWTMVFPHPLTFVTI
jgi:hypothetical protein